MESSLMTCTNCGGGNVRRGEVRSAFWHDERLVVVEDIPALLCESCGEQFYDDATVVVLDLLRGDGFREAGAKSRLSVPVFSFRDHPRAAEAS